MKLIGLTVIVDSFLLETTLSLNALRHHQEGQDRQEIVNPVLLEERELQTIPPEVCGYNIKWEWENDGYKHPVVPCVRHSDCFDFTDTGGWEPCCMYHDCLCGTAQSLFSPGVLHCGKFACNTNEECWPGTCIAKQCNFDNVQPCCTHTEDCGDDPTRWDCINGMCYSVDPETRFHRPSNACNRQPETQSQIGRNPSGSSGGGKDSGKPKSGMN